MEPETNDARYAARQRWNRQPAAYAPYPPQEETYEDYGAHEAYPQQEVYPQHEGYPQQDAYAQHEGYPSYESYTHAGGYPGHEPAPEPTYHVPESPEAGWDAAPSRRRDWVSRAILLAILAIQAVLSLRLDNTAFQDEALYLYAGHMEIANLLHGTPTPIDYNTYFSGSPVLYPVLAAAVDGTFGLIGARLLSLAFMLGTTTLLYAFTRRMFNERVALVAAAMFAVTQSAIVMGNFATYDAAALFLLALTTWIVVRTDRAPIAAVLLAAPIGVLAVGVKYASALYLPTIVVLAVLTSWPHRKWRALLRGVLLAVFVGGIILLGAKYTDVLSGVQQTTTNREHGTDSTWSLIEKSRDWGGLMFLTACGGLVSYIRRSRMNESPLSLRMSGPGWRWRTLLALTLCGTALLAPAYQIHLHTSVSLFKHIGFGLLFAAPMAGIGVTRLVGAHFRYPQLGILVWVVMLCLGLSQSTWRFGVWSDSSRLVSAIKPHVNKEGRYLAETYEVPIYYLRDRTNQRQWTSTFFISYQDKKGKTHTGRDGYRQAIKDGYFDMVVLDMVTTPEMDAYIAGQMKGSPHYRLLGNVPFKNSSGHGEYRIWIKQ